MINGQMHNATNVQNARWKIGPTPPPDASSEFFAFLLPRFFDSVFAGEELANPATRATA